MNAPLIVETTLDVMSSGAVFSPDRLYRYRLWRTLRLIPSRMLFVMQNPSKANAADDDMTVTKCVGFASRKGMGLVEVVNAYAFIATEPKDLWASRDPVGPENNNALQMAFMEVAAKEGSIVCAAWGDDGAKNDDRIREIVRIARACGVKLIHCLGVTKKGNPKHPSRLGYDAPLIVWKDLAA